MVELLNNSFLIFKQYYTYLYTLFHSYVFQKTTNNIIQTSLPNSSKEILLYASILLYMCRDREKPFQRLLVQVFQCLHTSPMCYIYEGVNIITWTVGHGAVAKYHHPRILVLLLIAKLMKMNLCGLALIIYILQCHLCALLCMHVQLLWSLRSLYKLFTSSHDIALCSIRL